MKILSLIFMFFGLLITNFGGVGESDAWVVVGGNDYQHKKTVHSPEWTDFNSSDPGVAPDHADSRAVVEVTR